MADIADMVFIKVELGTVDLKEELIEEDDPFMTDKGEYILVCNCFITLYIELTMLS